MTDGFYGLIGVFVGSLMTLISQIVFDKLKDKKNVKKTLLKNYEFFTQKIRRFNTYISLLIGSDLLINAKEKIDTDYLMEYQKNLDTITENCYENCDEFLSIVYEFFPQIISDKYFQDFIYVVNEIICSRKRINIGDNEEIVKNRYEYYIENKRKINNAQKFIGKLNNNYQKKIFGRKSKVKEINIFI